VLWLLRLRGIVRWLLLGWLGILQVFAFSVQRFLAFALALALLVAYLRISVPLYQHIFVKGRLFLLARLIVH